MAPFDRSLTTSHQCTIVSIAISCTISEIFDVEEFIVTVTLESTSGVTHPSHNRLRTICRSVKSTHPGLSFRRG